MTWKFLPLADHPHPNCIGPDHLDRQEAAHRLLDLIDAANGPAVIMHTVPGTCPAACDDPAHGSDDPFDSCRDAITHMTIDLDSLRRAIDPDDVNAHYDRHVLDLAGSLLGQGSVDLGAALQSWTRHEYDAFFFALALVSGDELLQDLHVAYPW